MRERQQPGRKLANNQNNGGCSHSGDSEDDFQVRQTVSATYLVKTPAEDDRILKLKQNQMLSTTLARISKLVPKSIILYGSDDSVVPRTLYTRISNFQNSRG